MEEDYGDMKQNIISRYKKYIYVILFGLGLLLLLPLVL